MNTAGHGEVGDEPDPYENNAVTYAKEMAYWVIGIIIFAWACQIIFH